MPKQTIFRATAVSPPEFEEMEFSELKRGDIFVVDNPHFDSEIFIAATAPEEGEDSIRAHRVSTSQLNMLKRHPALSEELGVFMKTSEDQEVFIGLDILSDWEQKGVSKWSRTFTSPLRKVDNKAAKFGSMKTYYQISVVGESGKPEGLLLTENDLKMLRERAAKNPEDL